MQASRQFSFLVSVAILLGIVACWFPALAFAGDPARRGAAPQPLPDVGRKVYTNDDLGWPATISAATTSAQPAAAAVAPPASSQAAGPAAGNAAVPSEPLNPKQDPRWYAEQEAPLDAELADIESKAQALREFRTTSAGLPTGLVLNALCEGITADNLIAQLELRRREILQRLDDLDDLAHRNGLEPGAIAEARTLAPIQPQLAAEQQSAALRKAYRERSGELAQTREVIASMQQYAAARGIALLMPTAGAGGNMTTDLLERLDARANALQSQLSATEDDARRAGFQPSLLR
jgi:hypothetical protein